MHLKSFDWKSLLQISRRWIWKERHYLVLLTNLSVFYWLFQFQKNLILGH